MPKIWQKNNTNIINENNHIEVYKINVSLLLYKDYSK